MKYNSKDYLIYRINITGKDYHTRYTNYQNYFEWYKRFVEKALKTTYQELSLAYFVGTSDVVKELMMVYRGIFSSIHWDRDEIAIPLIQEDLINWVTTNPPPHGYIIKRTHTLNWKDKKNNIWVEEYEWKNTLNRMEKYETLKDIKRYNWNENN